jgi:superfamily II DNA or RNA helicase
MIEDRQYQTDVIAEFHRTTAHFKRIILVAPTGSGKTVIASAIIKDYVKRHKTVLVLCHRGEIVNQTVAKLREFGMWCGIICGRPHGRPTACAGTGGVDPDVARTSHSIDPT